MMAAVSPQINWPWYQRGKCGAYGRRDEYPAGSNVTGSTLPAGASRTRPPLRPHWLGIARLAGPADNRCDLKPGAAVERRHLAEHGNHLRRYRYFFLRFAQCCNDRGPIFGVGFTAGEGHRRHVCAANRRGGSTAASARRGRRSGLAPPPGAHCVRSARPRQLQLKTADKGVQ